MELNQYISLIENSTLEQSVKDSIIQKLNSEGLTMQNLEELVQVLEAHIRQINLKIGTLDQELESKLREFDSELMDELNQKIEADEQAAAAEAEEQLNKVEQEFKAEKEQIQNMLTAIETALAAEDAKAHAE